MEVNQPDPRIAQAREYFASVRRHLVLADELPPSVLVRENAELRRQLGQLLDVIGQAGEGVPGWNDPLPGDPGPVPDEAQPYCTECGCWAGRFIGMDGWHHFDTLPDGKTELRDPGHEPVIGWITP